MNTDIQRLRRHAIASTLFAPMTLRQVLRRLGFVQADPIRSPARAQDLILRLRVTNYRSGDIDASYLALGLEEDFFYAYGFMPQTTWRLLHPRVLTPLTPAEEQVLAVVASHKQMHPRDLEAYFGREREVNAWGGYSKATTRALQSLHYRGLLRITGRDRGIRLYERAAEADQPLSEAERVREIVLLVATIFAPMPERSFSHIFQLLVHGAPALHIKREAVSALIASGELQARVMDGVRYVWPAKRVARPEPEDKVSFLAPFDPLVWDRYRFEHLWGWSYRFEAYTPAPKRKFGYYAMPMLWREDVVGWVNISRSNASNSRSNGSLTAEPGFITKRPTDKAFKRAYDAELARFTSFLRVEQDTSGS